MKSIGGSSISGARLRISVRLEMDDLTNGSHYVLGDQLTGRLFIKPQQDLNLNSVYATLEYVVKGSRRTTKRIARHGRLRGIMEMTGGVEYIIPLRLLHEFEVQNYTGKYLRGYWRLTVYIDYDLNQYKRPITEKLIDSFKDNRHGTAFSIPVRAGKGSYQVRGKALPIDFLDKKFFGYLAFILGVGTIAGFNIISSVPTASVWPALQLAFVATLLLTVIWHFIRLDSFQMTPFELQPLRDGQMRFRALDRGNGQLDKATIGYRLNELHVVKSGKSESVKRTAVYEKAERFADVAHRKAHLYEASLPWPDHKVIPTTVVQEGIGFSWEVFLRINNQEVSWPVTVGWEPFRLPKEMTEHLKLKDLEEVKVREKMSRQ